MFVPRSVTDKEKKLREAQKRPKTATPSCATTATTTTVIPAVSSPDSTQKPPSATNERVEDVCGESSSDCDIVLLSKHQRMAVPGEPTCIVCGKYGEYIVDETDRDVCSIECKKQHLRQLAYVAMVATGSRRIASSGESSSSGTGPTVDGNEDCVRGGQVSSAITKEQAEFLRKQVGIMVDSNDTPFPMMEFSQLPLLDQLAANLKEAGYVVMTPIQMQVIPAVMSGRDLLVSSSTGSGKSLSFLLPLIHQLTVSRDVGGAKVLILSPTRELCIQLEDQAKELMRAELLGIPDMLTALIVGGVPVAHQLHRLSSKNIKVIIGTPGRLKDIVSNNAPLLRLSEVNTVVLDEVDSLLEMGFENQITTVLDELRPSRQNLMFSATIPQRTEKLARDILVSPLHISVGKPGAPCSSIAQTILWVEEEAKKKQLFSMITDKDLFHPPAIVFVNSRKGCLLLAEALNKVADVPTMSIHGEMEQDMRSNIFSGLRQGKYQVVVSTGLLARGIHLDSIRQVFVFDMPNTVEEFVHQVGRAGRLDSPGWAISFINNENKGIFLDLIDLLQDTAGVHLPQQLLTSPHVKTQRIRRSKKHSMNEIESSYLKKSSLMSLILKKR